MAVDFDGDLLMQMGDKMVMDTDSGELHIISSCQTMKMITKITAAKSFGISLPPLSCESQVRQLPYEVSPLLRSLRSPLFAPWAWDICPHRTLRRRL